MSRSVAVVRPMEHLRLPVPIRFLICPDRPTDPALQVHTVNLPDTLICESPIARGVVSEGFNIYSVPGDRLIRNLSAKSDAWMRRY